MLNVKWKICEKCLPRIAYVLAWKHRIRMSPWITQLVYIQRTQDSVNIIHFCCCDNQPTLAHLKHDAALRVGRVGLELWLLP